MPDSELLVSQHRRHFNDPCVTIFHHVNVHLVEEAVVSAVLGHELSLGLHSPVRKYLFIVCHCVFDRSLEEQFESILRVPLSKRRFSKPMISVALCPVFINFFTK